MCAYAHEIGQSERSNVNSAKVGMLGLLLGLQKDDLTLPLRHRSMQSHSKLRWTRSTMSMINDIKTKHSEKVAAFLKVNRHLKKAKNAKVTQLNHLHSVLQCILYWWSIIQIFSCLEWARFQWMWIIEYLLCWVIPFIVARLWNYNLIMQLTKCVFFFQWTAWTAMLQEIPQLWQSFGKKMNQRSRKRFLSSMWGWLLLQCCFCYFCTQ